MSDAIWVRVTTRDRIPLREGRAVTVAGRELAIFNLGPSTEPEAGDRFLAVANRCPHQGGPLCDGIVTAASVVCPLHAWKVNLQSGEIERPASTRCVETFPVRVDGDVISVALPAGIGAKTARGAAA